MSGICIAKIKNQDLPTEQQIENCFRYSSYMGFAYNRNGKIYIHRSIENIDDYNKIIKKEKISSNCGILYKFSSYGYKNNMDVNQPLIICDNYQEMLDIETKKSVMVFHDEPIGFENEENISASMQFCKELSNFDRKSNNQIFNLSIGDNLSAILNPNGSIELFGLEKHKKWENENKIYFSDNDYKYSGYVQNSNNVYSYNNVYGYNDEYSDDYNDEYWNEKYVCDRCKITSTCLTLSNGKMLCDKCLKK